MDVGNLIFGSFDFLKSSLCILRFLVQVLLKPSLKDFEHYLASMWNEHNCAVVWTFFGIALLWDWNESWPFPVATTEFSKFTGILSPAFLYCSWSFCGKNTGVDCQSLLQEIKLVNPKGNQPWIFIGRTDAKAESPILWPPDVKSQLTRKDPDTGKDWRQKEKRAADGWIASAIQWAWT